MLSLHSAYVASLYVAQIPKHGIEVVPLHIPSLHEYLVNLEQFHHLTYVELKSSQHG